MTTLSIMASIEYAGFLNCFAVSLLLSIIMLSVIMLSVILLNAIMLSVVAH